MQNIEIIPYQENAHDKLVDIWLRAVRQTHAFLTEEDIRFYHDIVKGGALKEVEIWMALHRGDKAPIGFIGLTSTNVEMLFVDPAYHGQSAGRQLLNHAISLKGREITVDVNEQNEKAAAFYKRFGFIQTGRSELDGSGRPFPLLHLKLGSEMN